MVEQQLKVLRVKLKSLTASFRQTGFITGYQPTLPVPPLSTIYGLISAAKGELIDPKTTKAGYVFKNRSKAIDVEKIYQVEGKYGFKENIVNREFLFDVEMYLYLTDLSLKECFETPCFQLLIGRSSDLAFIEEVKLLDLVHANTVEYRGTILPENMKLPGFKIALASHFLNTVPRRQAGVNPFLLLGNNMQCRYSGGGLIDKELNCGVYLHDF